MRAHPAGLVSRLGTRLAIALFLVGALPAHAAAQQFVFDGNVPATNGDFFYLDFTVTAGVQEIEIRHSDLSSNNILDWGVDDADGAFRGWGGGNPEPAILGVDRASRSYLTGPLTPGTWRVVVGKAKIVDPPGQYHVEVYTRDTPTLAPQPERTPYVPAAPLASGPRWFAGDLHVHSLQSGDANASLDQIATLASNRGLDFVILSDHNTTSQFDYVVDAQARHPDLLLIPGDEFTTYYGHANAIGIQHWVNHRIGEPGATIDAAIADIHGQGALFSINHPKLDLGPVCIGCAWDLPVAPGDVDGVEIANGGWSEAGNLFDVPAIHFWEALLDSGSHAVPLGGSDDHTAGVDEGPVGSPIGDPTTMVFADDLSAASIVAAIREGRTVVKLQNAQDPMVELSADPPFAAAVSSASHAVFTAHVTGGSGVAGAVTVRFVVDGAPRAAVPVSGDPFDVTLSVDGPARVRAEVDVDGKPRTVTAYRWLTGAASHGPGCSCALSRADGPRQSRARGITAALCTAVAGLTVALARRRRHPLP